MASSDTGVSFAGLASGLDTEAIIKAMVQVANAPVNRLTNRKSNYTAQKSKLSTLSSYLSSLETAAKAIDTSAEFKAYSATVSTLDSAYVDATASTAASPGTYDIDVITLASAERTYSDAFASKNTAGLLGSGTLSIQIGTATATNISITASDTLETAAAKINSANAGVTAGVVYTGSDYALVVNGTKTGVANAVTFTEGGTLALGLSFPSNEVQAATDASIQMDGQNITSTTNSITSVIPGVTMTLKKITGATPVTVTVKEDLDKVVENVTTAITAFNKVANFLKAEFTYIKGANNQARLIGDSAVRNVQTKLKQILTGTVSTASEPYTALSRVGVTTQKDGSMKLDATKLKAALAEDLEGVTKLFTVTDGNESTDNDGVMVGLIRSIKAMVQTPDGIIAARTKGIDDSIRQIDSRVSSLQRSLSTYEAGLRRQFTALENLLSGLQSQSTFLSQNSLSTTKKK